MMKLFFRTLLVALATIAVTSIAFGQTDRPGSKDFPGISRMPNYFIDGYKDSTFEAFSFPVTANKRNTQQSIEGHYYQIEYRRKPSGDPVSGLQIKRNYQNAATAKGGKVLFDDGPQGQDTTFVLTKPGSEIWVLVHVASIGPTEYYLNIVEKQTMAQEVTIDAAAMASSIADTGSVAIYGINFDTASSVIKPDSEPAIDEIAKLLTSNPALKVGIVGHTDMVGDAASNLKLSMARAQSVITALVSKHGIAATRLVAFGAGPWAPVASNKTEDGRAKNRRVELVEIATK
jgi:outer membrane protein OmpA-like peptidoglycan-associated protein